MVQILPQFDPGAQIGQALGGGLGELLSQKARQQQLSGALQSGLDLLKPQEVTGPDGKITMRQPSFRDALQALIPTLGSIPGGMQALGELAPVLRQEMIREARMQQAGGGPPTETVDTVTETEQPLVSPQERLEQIKQQHRLAGIPEEQVAPMASQQLQAESAEASRRQQQETFATETYKTSLQEQFGGDIDPRLASAIQPRFLQLSQRMPAAAAWEKILPKLRAGQAEIVNLGKIGDRPLISMDASESIEDVRQAIPVLRKEDPELARSIVMKEKDMGLGEASLVVREGSDKFQAFSNKMKSRWREKGEPAARAAAAVTLGKKVPDIGPIIEKQEKDLIKFLQNQFDPEKDSLLALRHEMQDAGIYDDTFRRVVNQVFSDAANNKRLSEFNRNEVSRLVEPSAPGLMEIFRGLGRGTFWQRAAAGARAELRGKR